MTSKRYDMATPRKGKNDKTFWTRIGTAWENEKGIQLVFDALPLPDAEGRCVANLFEPRNDRERSATRDQAQARDNAGGGSNYDDEDSIPF